MRVVFENHMLFRDSIQAITEIIDEGMLKFTEKGIELVAADRAVICVVAFHMSRDRFKEYEVEDEEEIGVNLVDFLKFIKRSKSSEVLALEKEDRFLKILFSNRTTRSFKLPMMKLVEAEKPPIERITEFKAEITLPADILADAIEDASLISDSLIFLVEQDRITIRAEGTTKETETVVEQGEGVSIQTEETIRARYSVEYLKKIIKGSKVGSDCKIFLASNYPMKIVFSDQGIRLGYILAPRLED